MPETKAEDLTPLEKSMLIPTLTDKEIEIALKEEQVRILIYESFSDVGES